MTPGRIVERLTEWARRTDWVDWLELAGSLGRGAGDRWSDVDAGIGLADGEDVGSRLVAVRSVLDGFDVVAGSAVEPFGEGVHVSVLYADSTELSLVVLPASFRAGLPPEATALVDKSGRLASPLPSSRWEPDEAALELWRYQAWTLCADAARHAVRGASWRALGALSESRDRLWRLWAHAHGLTFPEFGAVTVSNAALAEPDGMAATHPSSLEPAELVRAVRALLAVLRTVADGGPVPEAIERRVTDLVGAS